MSTKNLLTSRGVKRTVTIASISGSPRFVEMTQLNAVAPSARLKLVVQFQLRDPRSQYITGCPEVDRAFEALDGNPTLMKIEAEKWERRPKFNHILDLSRPKLVVGMTKGSRTVGETGEIGVLSAQINLGRNPVIWLTW